MDAPEANTCSLDDGKVQDGVVGRQTDNMPVKVLIQEKMNSDSESQESPTLLFKSSETA